MEKDEKYILEPVITEMQISPDEKYLAIVRKQADFSENRYEYRLEIRDTAGWEPLREAELIKKGGVWWISEDRLMVSDEKDSSQILWVSRNQEERIPAPGKITDLIFQDAERMVLLVQEERPQDPDFFETEELPFVSDGSGYIKNVQTLWLYGKEKGEWSRLTTTDYQVRTASSDGNMVWFAGYERDNSRVDYLYSGVYRISLGEKETPETILPDMRYRIDGLFLLEGYGILAASDMKTHGPNENPKFYRLDEDGRLSCMAENEKSARHTVVRDWKGTTQRMKLSKEGVEYLSTWHGDVILRRLNLDGNIEDVLCEPGIIDNFYRFHDGRMITVGSYCGGFDEVYLYEEGKRKAITHYHDKCSQELEICLPYRYAWTDRGQTVEYFVLPPKHMEDAAEKSCPAIVSIHGGHAMAYGANALMMDFQLWSDEGYFVIFCNPRGSDGIDNKFADIIGQNGGIDAQDILHVLDLVLAQWPQIDPKCVGITGGSYGGYLTNWIVTQSDRFACAVSVRSISNRISKQMSGDTGFRYPLVRLENRVWEDAEAFWDASPLKYIQNCKTPTLLIHAEGDWRCPMEQGIQMYTALKLLGVPTKLILFKGESHGLAVSGKPLARLKHSREIRRWFDTYLRK